MQTLIVHSGSASRENSLAVICTKQSNLKKYGLSDKEVKHIKDNLRRTRSEQPFVITAINRFSKWLFSIHFKKQDDSDAAALAEQCRRAGNDLLAQLNSKRIANIVIADADDNLYRLVALAEGLTLGNYQFLKYKSKKEKQCNSLKKISVNSSSFQKEDIFRLNTQLHATCLARDLVNEPQNTLTAEAFSTEMERMGNEAGFHVEVLHKPEIEALKMGGLLAVNRGSVNPPTFTIMKWSPENPLNKKPYILVGKGIVYDTGGLSLKPTLNSMDAMKCDMSGGAAVAATMWAVAKAKLPLNIIGLVPATDNRPSGDAYAPGDVITMHSGKTVEVLNTDAEGRLILGDALSYAKTFKPELVIDLATLTGSAARAIGHYGIVGMGTAGEEIKKRLADSGINVQERIVWFPLWDDYGELIKSDVADIKNTGGADAGAITAGKFLEHFIDYPWIHLDIAGPAFITKKHHYSGPGGTGIGVRLLIDFFQKMSVV